MSGLQRRGSSPGTSAARASEHPRWTGGRTPEQYEDRKTTVLRWTVKHGHKGLLLGILRLRPVRPKMEFHKSRAREAGISEFSGPQFAARHPCIWSTSGSPAPAPSRPDPQKAMTSGLTPGKGSRTHVLHWSAARIDLNSTQLCSIALNCTGLYYPTHDTNILPALHFTYTSILLTHTQFHYTLLSSVRHPPARSLSPL